MGKFDQSPKSLFFKISSNPASFSLFNMLTEATFTKMKVSKLLFLNPGAVYSMFQVNLDKFDQGIIAGTNNRYFYASPLYPSSALSYEATDKTSWDWVGVGTGVNDFTFQLSVDGALVPSSYLATDPCLLELQLE
jgi:hypothetical protein